MENIKQINIKNLTYYFFNDMINIEDFDSSLLKTGKKSYKNIDIYYIRYITIKSISDYQFFFYKQLIFFWPGLWLLKLENQLRSQVA